MRKRQQRFSRGFSLIEMMTVFAIIGIIMGMTVFAVSGLANRTRATTFLGELALDIPYARNLAAQYSQPVVIVFNCDTNPARESLNGYWIYRETSLDPADAVDFTSLALPLTNTGLAREKFMPMNNGRCILAPAKPSSSTARFGDAAKAFPWKSLFDAVDAANRPTCSFCSAYDSTAQRGAIRVSVDGVISLSGPGNADGGGAMYAKPLQDNTGAIQALVILAPTAMTQLF